MNNYFSRSHTTKMIGFNTVLMIIMIFVIPFRTHASPSFAGGDGTSEHPYQIATCSQFESINDDVTLSYELTQSLDCTGEGNNIMVGLSGNEFSGTFDGGGYSMKVTIDDESDLTVGLFQGVAGGTIKDFTIASGSMVTGDIITGSIAGGIIGGKLIGVHSYATVVGLETDWVDYQMYLGTGGLVGAVQNSEIIGSSFQGNVSSYAFIGGIVGMVFDETGPTTSIIDTSNTGDVTGSIGIGGIIGYSVLGGSVVDSYSSGTITGNGINAFENALGGAGGIVGITGGDTTINRTYSSGAIVGNENDNFPSGGIVGTDFGSITTVIDSWSTASITGIPEILGGIVGGATGEGSYEFLYNNYYDGFATGLGVGDCVGIESNQSGDTLGQCQSVDTTDDTHFKNTDTIDPLNNWDFDNVWSTSADYPTLNTYVDNPRTPDQVMFNDFSTQRTEESNTAQVTLDWNTPYEGTDPISDYDIKYRLVGDTDWTTWSHDSSTDTTATITGLVSGSYYDFWVSAVNNIGEGDGGIITFLVGDGNSIPTLSVQSVSDITATSATLNGTIVSTGGANVTEHGFQYGDQENTFDTTSIIPLTDPTDGDGTGAYQSMITGLTCGTTYYYRFYAINEVGTGYSDTDGTSFTTSACPVSSSGGVSGGSSAITWTPQTGMVVHTVTNSTTTPTIISTATSITRTPITKILKLGSLNSDVKLLQQFLNTHGYVVTLNGAGSSGHETITFGTKTKQALIKFQKDHGLVSDGIVGPTTQKEINSIL